MFFPNIFLFTPLIILHSFEAFAKPQRQFIQSLFYAMTIAELIVLYQGSSQTARPIFGVPKSSQVSGIDLLRSQAICPFVASNLSILSVFTKIESLVLTEKVTK